MSIPFTQYLLPNGRMEVITIDMPEPVERAAQALIEAGCHFDAEILTTGLISLTCEEGEDLLSIEVCENNEAVLKAVENLIREAAGLKEIPWDDSLFEKRNINIQRYVMMGNEEDKYGIDGYEISSVMQVETIDNVKKWRVLLLDMDSCVVGPYWIRADQVRLEG